MSGYPREAAPFGAPVVLEWDGWQTRTDLLRNWEIFCESDAYAACYRLAIRHKETGICGMGILQRHSFWNRGDDYRETKLPTVHLGMRMGAQQVIQYVPDHYGDLVRPSRPLIEVEGYPSFRPPQAVSVEDLLPFRPKENKRILMEADPSIDALLDQLLAKQAPAKQAYFEEKVKTSKLLPASSAEIIQFGRAA